MEDAVSTAKVRLKPLGWWWLGALVATEITGLIAGLFDNSTELTPDHSDTLNLCFAVTLGMVAISMFIGLWQSRGLAWARGVVSIITFGGIAAIGSFTLALHLHDIVWAKLDFPASKTKTFVSRLRINRAYQTHGKGRDWCIQTMPLWSNLRISEIDYDYMGAHRRPGDPGKNPDEISSQGYFCATVTLQTSGNAIRVLNAGNGVLPIGTVSICPQAKTPP